MRALQPQQIISHINVIKIRNRNLRDSELLLSEGKPFQCKSPKLKRQILTLVSLYPQHNLKCRGKKYYRPTLPCHMPMPGIELGPQQRHAMFLSHESALRKTVAVCSCNVTEPGHAKMCLMTYANNKGADQPAHPCSLISTFVVCCLDSIICILALSKVSRF